MRTSGTSATAPDSPEAKKKNGAPLLERAKRTAKIQDSLSKGNLKGFALRQKHHLAAGAQGLNFGVSGPEGGSTGYSIFG